ncbi:hypothetical protein [Embleya hyalina]|uniref:Uncharacterized protein n=1 Tax=Embleya hyalina TaxID=516124 RepID=A0A401YE29_9ACTN|nr:hypothetical protein [Embleya hyalina]GCD92845.1 hypothetical protein EHYA_00487 [Embleya hyalina]
MGLWNRRGAPDDPANEPAGDPTEALGALGLTADRTAELAATLRGPVTEVVLRDLPRIELSAAPRWLHATRTVIGSAAPALVRDMVPGLDAEQAAAAAFHPHLLPTVAFELRHRRAASRRAKDPGALARTGLGALKLSLAVPTGRALVHDHIAARIGADAAKQLAAGHAETIRSLALVDPSDRARRHEPAWGAWGLLDVLQALLRNREALGEPALAVPAPPTRPGEPEAVPSTVAELGLILCCSAAIALIEALPPTD